MKTIALFVVMVASFWCVTREAVQSATTRAVLVVMLMSVASGSALGISVMNVENGRMFCVQSAQTLTAEVIPLVKLPT